MARNNYRNRKGSDFEYKVAELVGEHWGAKAMRTIGSGSIHRPDGFQSEGDIVVDHSAQYPFVVEAKKHESIELGEVVRNVGPMRDFYMQVVVDADRVGKTPLVVFSKNYRETMVLIPYRADMFSQLVVNDKLAVALNLQIEDKLTDEKKGYLVIMTTFDGFSSIPKEYYIESYTKDKWDWKENTIIYYKKRGEVTSESIQEEAASILSFMFDGFDKEEEVDE